MAEKIKTVEASIEPYENCYTIVVAKHPVTKPELAVIEASEKLLAEQIDNLLEEAIVTAEVIMIK